ncbi:hypothetical protein B6D51_17095 [Pseudomonas chlororaphis subsp. chlororaphis]|nr:hypothetical protein B6D51_17095 [Pseudomonas chlororaphis subsp. chlororaphis]
MYNSERAHADPFAGRYGAGIAGACGQGPMPDAGLEAAGGAAGISGGLGFGIEGAGRGAP